MRIAILGLTGGINVVFLFEEYITLTMGEAFEEWFIFEKWLKPFMPWISFSPMTVLESCRLSFCWGLSRSLPTTKCYIQLYCCLTLTRESKGSSATHRRNTKPWDQAIATWVWLKVIAVIASKLTLKFQRWGRCHKTPSWTFRLNKIQFTTINNRKLFRLIWEVNQCWEDLLYSPSP